MNRLSVPYWSAALWLMGAVGAAGQDVVPIDREPRHRLAFEDAEVRVFDTRIAPGDTTLYHRHERDSVYVLISGTSNLVTEQLGKPAKPVSAKPGDVFFGEHTKAPLTHRFSNLSAEEHHVLDIEIIAGRPHSLNVLPSLAGNDVLVLENARVRVSRVALQSGAIFPGDPASAPLSVLVALAGGRLSVMKDSQATQRVDAAPGWFHARSDSASPQIRNNTDEPLEFINIEIK